MLNSMMDMKDHSHPMDNVSKVTQAKLNILLASLLATCSDIRGAMVGSVDGMSWAHSFPGNKEFDPDRFAAMSSSLLALGDNIIRESQSGTARNVLLENDSGNVFIMHAGSKLLLTVFAKANANLGLSLAHAKKTAEDIRRLGLDATN